MPCQIRHCASFVFILVLCSSAPAGQTQCRVEDRGVYADEKAAYELLTRYGGSCNVNFDGHLLNVWAYKPVPAEFFRSLKSCTQIETLWIGSDDASFAALAALPDLPTLDAINIYRILNIMNTRVTDAGLVHLRNAKSLSNLAVDGTAVTLDGIAELKPYLPALGRIQMPAAGRIRVPTSERIHTAEKAAEPDKLAATRPFVKARLKNGTRVEGLLMRFAEGVYTVKQAESLAEIREADIWEITFVSPRSSSQGTSSLRDRLAFLSQPACVQDLIDAYHSLGPKAATEMGELLTDSDPQVRRMAAQAISNWATWGRTALPRDLQAPLIKALHDNNPQVRHLIPGPLANLGESSDEVIGPLAETLAKEPDGQVGRAMVEALYRIAWRRSIGDRSLNTIIAALGSAAADHPETQVRVHAIVMLGKLGEKGRGAVEALRRASDDPNNQVREAARKAQNETGETLREALRKLGVDEPTTAALVAMTAGRPGIGMSRVTQRQRSEALERLKADGEKNLPALMAAVRLDDEGGRWLELAQVIAAWGEPALPALAKYVDDPNPRVRRTVALAIGDMRPKTLPDALRMLLGDRDEWVRDSAVVGLCRISGQAPFARRDPAPPEVIKAVVPLLIEVLANPRLPVDRSDVIISTLGQIGPDHPAAVPTLLKTLKQSSQRQQRDYLVNALGGLAVRLRSDEELKPIVQALSDVVQRDAEAVVRIRAASYLGGLGARAKAALPALQKAAADADPGVAKYAGEAVARISRRCGRRFT